MDLRDLVALAALALAAAACHRHHPPPPPVEVRYVPPAAVMTVHNAGARPLASLRIKPCGAPESAFRELPGSGLAAGARYAIPTEGQPPCVDLEAIDPRGQVAGKQHELRLTPGGSWTIQ